MKKLLFAFLILSASMLAQTTCVNCGGGINANPTSNTIPKSAGATSNMVDSALSDNATNVISTEGIQVPAGTVTNPSLQWSETGAPAGWYRFGANDYILSVGNSTTRFRVNASQTVIASQLGFSNGSVHSVASTTFLTWRAAANLSLGQADVNGVPVAQTLSVQNAITGTNLAGAQFTIAGPLGTGTALPAPSVIQGADASVASGGTAQTEINRLVVGDTKNLTTGAATTVLSVPLATLQMMGGTIDYYMEATDGTNQCTSKGTVDYSGENSAGVFVVGVTAIGNLSSSCTATKTLTATWAVTSANPSLIQITPTLTGITATRFTLVYEVHHMGNTNPTL